MSFRRSFEIIEKGTLKIKLVQIGSHCTGNLHPYSPFTYFLVGQCLKRERWLQPKRSSRGVRSLLVTHYSRVSGWPWPWSWSPFYRDHPCPSPPTHTCSNLFIVKFSWQADSWHPTGMLSCVRTHSFILSEEEYLKVISLLKMGFESFVPKSANIKDESKGKISFAVNNNFL